MRPEENTPSANPAEPKVPPKTEPTPQAAKPAAAQPKKPSGFQSALRQIGLALLFLVIGMLAILLALYLPVAGQLKKAESELERLTPIETQYLQLQDVYTDMEAQTLVYKMMSHTSQLKAALAENDVNKISQQLTYIENDLNQLVLSDFPDLPASLTAQFEKAKTAAASPSSAVDEVDKFYEALLNLSDNLQQ